MPFYQQKYFRPYQELARPLHPLPSRRESPDPHYPQPIWDHLYNEGLRAHHEIIQRHQESKRKLDTECTFRPILQPSHRYLVNSNSTFLERVNLWNEHKNEKIVKEKQEVVSKGLKQCTFAPKTNRRPTYSPAFQRTPTTPTKNTFSPYHPTSNQYSPARTSQTLLRKTKPPSGLEIDRAKLKIRSQLRKMLL